MAYKEVMIDSVRYAEVNGKRVTIRKRKDADVYFPIYINASQANIIKKELIPSRFGDLWEYQKFLVGRDVSGYDLESLVIDEPDGNVSTRLVFRKCDNIMETECPGAGTIALAFRKNTRIFIQESSFYTTVVTG